MKQAILILPNAPEFTAVRALAAETFAHVHVATSLAQCFELLAAGFADALVCALRYTANLRADPRCKNIPIITICVAGDSLSDLFTLGSADEVLFLPVSQEEFLFRCLKAQQNWRRGGMMERRQRDRVTGFLNAPALQGLGSSLKQQATRGAISVLYYFAITNLQTLAQEFGSSLADGLLSAIARRLEGLSPKPGSSFIRLADSILLLVEGHDDKKEAGPRLAVLKLALNQPYEVAGIKLVARIEIGAAVSPGEGETPEELLQIAFAKTWSNDSSAPVPSFLPKHKTPSLGLDGQSTRLIEALRNRQLDLDYQPVFDFKTGSIVALEALLHWPKGKLWQQCRQALIDCNLNGLGFTGLTEVVIERASQDLQLFTGWSGPICVNIGIDGLRLAKLAMNLARLVQSGKIGPNRFELLMPCPQGQWRKPHGFDLLHDLGFALAVDLAANVKGAGTIADGAGLAMVKLDAASCASADAAAIIAPLRVQGLRLLASKLENAEDVAQARRIGCSCGQGYFFASPQSASAVASALRPVAEAL